MKYIVSIDPGISTGVVVGQFSDVEPFSFVKVEQIPNGLAGLLEHYGAGGLKALPELLGGDVTVICERFTPRPMRRSYKSNELEPLRIEGFLIGQGVMPVDYADKRWRSPQYLVLKKGASAYESKKLSDDVLRGNGLWLTGKMVGQPDANDVISATKHALSYLAGVGHQPTLEWLS